MDQDYLVPLVLLVLLLQCLGVDLVLQLVNLLVGLGDNVENLLLESSDSECITTTALPGFFLSPLHLPVPLPLPFTCVLCTDLLLALLLLVYVSVNVLILISF